MSDVQSATPLPYTQLFVIGLVQLTEPLAGGSIFTFINKEILDLGIASSEKSVGFYAGLIESLFFISSAIFVLQWGKQVSFACWVILADTVTRYSDRVGRKKVVLLGLCGVSFSMTCFGLSKHLWSLALSRMAAGAMSGNVAITKAAVAEITDDSNRGRAMSFMSVAFSTGFVIGPLLSGSLVNNSLNDKIPFLQNHPYFLSCAAAACFPALATISTALLFKETKRRPRSDYVPLAEAEEGGLPPTPDTPSFKEEARILVDEPLYTAYELLCMPRVRAAVLNYGTLALADIAWFATISLFMFTSVESGGLGFPPSNIGRILASLGVVSAISGCLIVPWAQRKFGLVKAFRFCVANYTCLILFMPCLNLLARKYGGQSVSVYVGFALMLVFVIPDTIAYGCVFTFVANSAPNSSALGSVNGIGQCVSSIARAFGPTFAQSIFALSVEHNLLGGYLIYLVQLVLVAIAVIASYSLSEDADKQVQAAPKLQEKQAL